MHYLDAISCQLSLNVACIVLMIVSLINNLDRDSLTTHNQTLAWPL